MSTPIRSMLIWLCAALLTIGYFIGAFVTDQRYADCPRPVHKQSQAAQAVAKAAAAVAECSTDSECMELCDPDDDECDGGPQ